MRHMCILSSETKTTVVEGNLQEIKNMDLDLDQDFSAG